MRRSCAPSIIQNGDPKKSRRGPSTRGGGARAGAEAAEAAHAAAKPALAPAAAAAAAQASLAAKKPYKVRDLCCVVGFAFFDARHCRFLRSCSLAVSHARNKTRRLRPPPVP